MRERDVRNAIRQALIDTDAFDEVHVSGKAEDYGISAGATKMCIIEPMGTSEDSFGDDVPEGAIVYVSRIGCTFVGRDQDPQKRDELAELLLDTAADVLNGNNFGLGDMIPAKTRFTGWNWKNPVAPERQIQAIFQATYWIDGWNQMDTTE